MNRFRRILIRSEKKPENYFGLLHLVCAIIPIRCAGLLGWAPSKRFHVSEAAFCLFASENEGKSRLFLDLKFRC